MRQANEIYYGSQAQNLSFMFHINIKYMCTYVCIIWVWKEICLFYFISFFFSFFASLLFILPFLTRHIQLWAQCNKLFSSVPFHSFVPSFFYCTLFIIVITMIYVAVLPLASPHTSDCSRSALILFFYMLSCSFHLVLNFFFFSLLQFRLNFWKNWITAVMLDIFFVGLFAYFKYSFLWMFI